MKEKADLAMSLNLLVRPDSVDYTGTHAGQYEPICYKNAGNKLRKI